MSDIRGLGARAYRGAAVAARGPAEEPAEAAACGRPIVATDVPGCREIVRPGETGLLVPVDDAAALADAIALLAVSPGSAPHTARPHVRVPSKGFRPR